MTKQYALIGAAGYIAPRHMRAIKDTHGSLKIAYDVNDSVGVIDSHFPDAEFFTDFERFESEIYKWKSKGESIDYVGICSPNYLHKSHINFSLRAGADAICEKPLVLNPEDLDELTNTEKETGQKLNSILQLRLHPSIIALREKVLNGPKNKVYEVDLGYFTSRGRWYHESWKGFEQKSGGIAANIGVHFFDMLGFVFGNLKSSTVHHRAEDAAAGYLEYQQARVRWVLSINRQHLPSHTPEGQTTHRSITFEGEEVEFSGGFTDLHTQSYQSILEGNGFSLEVVRPSIELVSSIRSAPLTPNIGETHPLLKQVQ